MILIKMLKFVGTEVTSSCKSYGIRYLEHGL